MTTYPFSSEQKENDFPGSGNDRKSHIFKNGNSLIEYDIDKILEYFPDLRGEDPEVIKAFLNSVNQSIVRVQS